MSQDILNINEFMDRVQHDKDLLFELLDIFVGDFQSKSDQLKEAVKKNDAKTIEHVAHFLKGSCGNISADSLRDIFIVLEENAQKGDTENAAQYLDEIDRIFEELVIYVGELRGKF